MKSINFVLLGDAALASQLGKKGTSTDIAIYDRKSSDAVYTWTTVVTYPDKIQPLLQAISIGEYAILNVTRLDRFLGEQILALDAAGPRSGFVLHSYDVDRERLKALIKGTVISNYNFVEDVEHLRLEIAKLDPIAKPGPLAIVADHTFDVKGVGTVILGVVRRGAVRVYDSIIIMPSGATAIIKSIQMHDDPVSEASSPARVGLAVKGPSADQVLRGDVLCSPNGVKSSEGNVKVKFSKSPFFKGELPEQHTYLLSVGAQIRSAKVKQQVGDLLEVSIERPIAFEPGQKCVLLKPDAPSNRIVGHGEITSG